MELNRRSFLQASSLSVGGVLLHARGGQAAEPPRLVSDAEAAGKSFSPVSLVNLLQGTASTGVFSRGNTLPIAAMPFGMAHWTLQSKADSAWMFQPGDRRLQGFRCTHQLSPWLGDYGHATFLPFCGDINPEPTARATSYRPESSVLLPHTLQVRLLRYDIDVELIPTERCALLRTTFAKAQPPGFLIDIPAGTTPIWEADETHRTVRFTSAANSGGVPPAFATYYVARFSEPWTGVEHKALKGRSVAMLRFAAALSSLDVQIATSFLSFEQAQRNLDLELGANSAEMLRLQGERVWNDHLGRIEVSGGSLDQQRTFYSCLYRTLLFPRVWHEPDAKGDMQHRSPYNGQVVAGVMYADHGYWDVYRAWYPLMTILFPDRLAAILQAWVNAYQEGGWLPQFPCPGYRACMTGSLIDSVFGDAACKGLPGFDLAKAYEALKKHATQKGDPDAGYGRRGLEEYLRFGYAPAGLVDQSAAETVDAAYGDFCIAQVAKALGDPQGEAMFLRRSRSWRHLFDPDTSFLRGKKADGTWMEPFDPVTWGDPYVEGSAWQHRWDVPHDIPGLIAAMGGKQKAVAALEAMLSMPPDFNVGAYGQEIHEMSEMAAVPFGQYAHSNQPVHHLLYLFAAAGRPDRTRYWVRKVMDELYTPDTFAGDEDTGSMSAWYVLSALGFYPVCPGIPEYTLGAAFFPSATVRLPGNRVLTVTAETTGEKITAVSLDGKALPLTIAHAEVMRGGALHFS